MRGNAEVNESPAVRNGKNRTRGAMPAILVSGHQHPRRGGVPAEAAMPDAVLEGAGCREGNETVARQRCQEKDLAVVDTPKREGDGKGRRGPGGPIYSCRRTARSSDRARRVARMHSQRSKYFRFSGVDGDAS